MSVIWRMIGREIPCALTDLLPLGAGVLRPARFEGVLERARLGQANTLELYHLGRWHLDFGELGLARKHFVAALRAWPGFTAARLGLAAAQDQLGQHDQAVEQLDAVLASADLPRPRYDLLCAAGLCLERAGRWGDAVDRYTQAMASMPTDQFALHRLVAIHLAQGQSAQAIDCLRQLLAHQPQDQAARVCLGHLLLFAGQRKQAVWEYEQALCLEPDTWELPLEMAGQLHMVEDPNAAIGILQQLIGDQPHFPDLRMRLGNLYLGRGDEDLARAEYHKALALHPEYLEAHIALARHEMRSGRTEPAREHFRRAMAINDQNVEAYAGLAIALREGMEHARAAEMMDSAVRIAHNSAVLAGHLAMIDGGNGWDSDGDGGRLWVAEQVRKDRMTLSEHADRTDVRLRLAMLLRLAGDDQEAKAELRRIVRDEPECSAAWIELGLLLASHGRMRKAAQFLENALRPNAQPAQQAYQLGLICCDPMGYDLAAEKLCSSRGEECRSRVGAVVDMMRLTGLRRRWEKAEAAL